MSFVRTFALAFTILAMACLAACVHRTPVWSPDGKWILVLSGEKDEKIDHGASGLWFVDVAKKSSRRVKVPEKGARFLSATWLDSESFVVATGVWEKDFVHEGTEKLWRGSIHKLGEWTAMKLPAPGGVRSLKRLPVVLGEDAKTRRLVYASGEESVSVVTLATGKVELELEYAEMIGPGPGGGFLVQTENDDGDVEVVAYGADLKPRWRRSFEALRAEIAKLTKRASSQVVFNETATSFVPPVTGGKKAEWIALNLYFCEVGWENGLPGFACRLNAADGTVRDVVVSKVLSGRPAHCRIYDADTVWAVTAPDKGSKVPMLRGYEIEKNIRRANLPFLVKKEQVYGYGVGPRGKTLVVSLGGSKRQLQFFDAKRLVTDASPFPVPSFSVELR